MGWQPFVPCSDSIYLFPGLLLKVLHKIFEKELAGDVRANSIDLIMLIPIIRNKVDDIFSSIEILASIVQHARGYALSVLHHLHERGVR